MRTRLRTPSAIHILGWMPYLLAIATTPCVEATTTRKADSGPASETSPDAHRWTKGKPPPRVKGFRHLGENAQGYPEYSLALPDGVLMLFVLVPAGSFMMGSPGDESGRNDNEGPQHRVTLDAFLLSKTECATLQWNAVTGATGFSLQAELGNPLAPIDEVSWEDAKIFAQKTGLSLPSESQWEYACRAGSTGRYPGTLDSIAWYDENSGYRTHGVLGKRPNDFGLHDMPGNVQEWCEDTWHESYFGAPTDGSPWISNGSEHRVTRGGAAFYGAASCRSAARAKLEPRERMVLVGFRPCKILSPRAQVATPTVDGSGISHDKRPVEPSSARSFSQPAVESDTAAWTPEQSDLRQALYFLPPNAVLSLSLHPRRFRSNEARELLAAFWADTRDSLEIEFDGTIADSVDHLWICAGSPAFDTSALSGNRTSLLDASEDWFAFVLIADEATCDRAMTWLNHVDKQGVTTVRIAENIVASATKSVAMACLSRMADPGFEPQKLHERLLDDLGSDFAAHARVELDDRIREDVSEHDPSLEALEAVEARLDADRGTFSVTGITIDTASASKVCGYLESKLPLLVLMLNSSARERGLRAPIFDYDLKANGNAATIEMSSTRQDIEALLKALQLTVPNLRSAPGAAR